MSASNRGWNLSSEHNSDHPAGDAEDDDANADRWIWGVWIVVALVAVAILPFASRFQDVARAVASFCGIKI